MKGLAWSEASQNVFIVDVYDVDVAVVIDICFQFVRNRDKKVGEGFEFSSSSYTFFWKLRPGILSICPHHLISAV